ncbi:ALQxL family class IV lanthipeptide [Streptosporangium sp. NPDC051022]
MELDITALDMLPSPEESRLYPCECTCTISTILAECTTTWR